VPFAHEPHDEGLVIVAPIRAIEMLEMQRIEAEELSHGAHGHVA